MIRLRRICIGSQHRGGSRGLHRLGESDGVRLEVAVTRVNNRERVGSCRQGRCAYDHLPARQRSRANDRAAILERDGSGRCSRAREACRYARGERYRLSVDRGISRGLDSDLRAVAVEQHAHSIASAVGHSQIESAVPVEVAGHGRVRVRSSAIQRRRCECSIAIAEQQTGQISDSRRSAGQSQIQLAVAVKVPYHYGGRIGAGGIGHHCLERTVAVAQQHADFLRLKVSNGQVKIAVAVEVAHRHGQGIAAGSRRIYHSRLERTVAIAQQHADIVVLLIHHDQVKFLISVEVPHRHGNGIVANGVTHCGPQSSIPIAQQHADGIAVKIRHDYVEVAVAVEVAHGNRCGLLAYRIIHVRKKCSVAFSDQHADRIGGVVRHHQVRNFVAVEVAYSHGIRVGTGSGGDMIRSLERSIAVAQNNRDCSRAVGRHCQIKESVAIEIGGCDRGGSGAGGIIHARLKSLVSVAEHYANRVAA